MPRHAETRQLPYTPEQMFDLVADVARYGEFLPWVAAVRVREDSPTEMIADLVVGFKGISERFTSQVHKSRPSSIRVDYLEGPLAHLTNEWGFRPDGQVERGLAILELRNGQIVTINAAPRDLGPRS